ncbi:hypothetical protein, partial [Mesorhizobium sp. M4B.F.Ca.ET.143.01.1.1]|uniref:hypothetical protein n=1 Tax=Mesorhizobium sp. M4B.F.Ca.ET.143.01.1.1 TaxID=2563947 RepID=UPI001AED4855
MNALFPKHHDAPWHLVERRTSRDSGQAHRAYELSWQWRYCQAGAGSFEPKGIEKRVMADSSC